MVDFYDIQSAEDTPSRTEHWLFKIVDLLAKRLDYGIGQSWMWLQLIETIGKMRGKEGSSLDYAVWEERKEWWPRMHFSKAREAYASDQGIKCALFLIKLCTELLMLESLVIYAVAAHYIANDAMFYKTFWPLATWIRDMLPLNDSCLSLLEQHGLSVDDICPPVASLFSSSSAASSPVSSIVNTRRSNRSRKRARTTEIDDISDGLDD